MRMSPSCVQCMVSQTVRLLTKHQQSSALSDQLLLETIAIISAHYPDIAPAHVGTIFHRNLKEKLQKDPFAAEKESSTRSAEQLTESAITATTSLHDRLRLATIANAIDFGITADPFEQKKLEACFTEGLAIDHRPELEERLSVAKRVLYIPDNCGEIIFDRAVIAALTGLQIDIAARPTALLNDAAESDLRAAGLDRHANLLKMSYDGIGVDYDKTSSDFKTAWKKADLIIAKGMGNFETLIDTPAIADRNIFFLLRAKCPPVAQRLGVALNNNVIASGRSLTLELP